MNLPSDTDLQNDWAFDVKNESIHIQYGNLKKGSG